MDMKSVEEVKANPNIPPFNPGDTVKVSCRIVEGERERLQTFQGVVLRIKGSGPGASFTVRRVSYGIGIERIFFFYSPRLEKVEVLRQGRVRRARLYYLRGLSGKAQRIKQKGRELGQKVAGAKADKETTPAEEKPVAQG